MIPIHQRAGQFPLHICVGSRECSTGLLERLPGATLFPERPIPPAIVAAIHRPGGSVICVAAPGLADAEEQIGYFLRIAVASTDVTDPRPPRDRVTLLSVDDNSSRWLSQKLMDPTHPGAVAARAHLRAAVERERQAGRQVQLNYVEPSEPLDRLAEELGVVGDQAGAWTIPLGTKSAGREIFAACDIQVAPGTRVVRDLAELAVEMVPLVRAGHREFVLKLDSTDFGAGLGNAFVRLPDDVEDAADLPAALVQHITRADVIDTKFGWAGWSADVSRCGVLAEVWLTGDEVLSPSFQGRLTSWGPQVVATHEQVLADNQQTFTGSVFPAREAYRALITEHGMRVGKALLERGVDRGDYAVDFIAARRGKRWDVYACEVNIRYTGTRHGFDMAALLLGEPGEDGLFHTEDGPRVYVASDGITSPRFVGIRPADLIEAVENSPLHWDPATKQGVVLHLLSPLVEFGKFGAICVAPDQQAADRMMADLRTLTLRLVDGALVTG